MEWHGLWNHTDEVLHITQVTSQLLAYGYFFFVCFLTNLSGLHPVFCLYRMNIISLLEILVC